MKEIGNTVVDNLRECAESDHYVCKRE